MHDEAYYKKIFDRYGGIMKTCELELEKVYYRQRERLIRDGYIEKIRCGYYQWIDPEEFSEALLITRMYPDAILCMDTALFYYGYSVRTPACWHLSVSKDSAKSRFKIDYPFVKPYYYEPSIYEAGAAQGKIDGYDVRIYDKDRVICDCIRYRNKMDREIFNKAVQHYVVDPEKNIARLLAYAKALHVSKPVKELIGVWL